MSRPANAERSAAVERGKLAGFADLAGAMGQFTSKRHARLIGPVITFGPVLRSLDGHDPYSETYDWCQGCDQTPNRRLMGWTADGRYLCRGCRGEDTEIDRVVALTMAGWGL